MRLHVGHLEMIDDIELTREVAELTRDVERLDSFIDIQRYLLEQRAPNEENAKRHWKQIRAGVGRITARAREILDEIAQPNPRAGYAVAGGRGRLAEPWRVTPPLSRSLPPRST